MKQIVKQMKVLIVDDIHPVFLDKLSDAGIRFDYRPEMLPGEAEQVISRYQGLVIRSKFRVSRAFMDLAPDLRFIARGGAGMDNIDEEYAQQKGITLLNAPEGNRQAVAEHMTGMLLSLLHKLRSSDSQIRQGQWLREENRGLELQGRTVGLIGYGHNGQAMARCLSGFGVRVLAYDKYKTGFGDPYAEEADMDMIFRQVDILSLHIPLTPETRNLVDTAYLSSFDKPIFFLNGARGEIADVQAVLDALDIGKVRGAAFDVLPMERFPALTQQPWFETLLAHPQVLLSPHVAGWTVESYFKIAEVLADKVIRLLGS